MHSQTALGEALTKGSLGRDTCEGREEGLAVLNVALTSAEKMSLRRHADLIREHEQQFE